MTTPPPIPPAVVTNRAALVAELWRPIPGFEGLYEVSTLGRVFSQRRLGSRGGLMRSGVNRHGYPQLNLSRDGKQTAELVHQLVMLAFVGPPLVGMEVRHLDGDRENSVLANLAYGTRRENRLDRAQHGTDHNLNKTHCAQGHEFTPENTFHATQRGGTQQRRACRECKRLGCAKRRARALAAALADPTPTTED